MTMTHKLLRIASALAMLGLSGTAFSTAGEPLAAAQGTDLVGGPAARGAGLAGARFDTRIYVSSIDPATGSVDFIYNGSIVTTVPFSLGGRSAAVLQTPQALEGIGAFLFRVHSDTPVTAWSETYNDTSSGQFGLAIQAVAGSDFLNPGDEASGGGADVSSSTDAGRARTNVGIVCSPSSSDSCTLEVAAFDRGSLVGTGVISTSHGSVGQNSLASLVPGTAEKAGLALRLRVITGSGRPYAIKNNNRTSDGSEIPLSVMRNVFSTGPTISSFLVTPNSGCPSSTFTASWTTEGASRVTLSGVGGDLPPSGSTTFTLLTSADVILT
ncbi:MAG TPA: hypothetical protein VGR00_01495, partial [Thermoanaerobaculia bacterium]|nr:hypothetical protein [Thermoanaerobaculia bacterium]